MPDCTHIHVPDDLDSLIIPKPDVLKDQLVDELGTIQTVRDRSGMDIRDLDVARIDLIRDVFGAAHHAETLGYVAIVVHLLVVLHQVTRLLVFTLHLVQLCDAIGMLILPHGVEQGLLLGRQVILVHPILITVLALARGALIHLWLFDPVEVGCRRLVEVRTDLCHDASLLRAIRLLLLCTCGTEEDQLLEIVNEIGNAFVLVFE